MKRIIVQQNIRKGGATGLFSRYDRGSRRPGRSRGGRFRRVATYTLVIGSAIFLAGTIGFIGLVAWFSRELPDPDKVSMRALSETTRIYDRTGEVVLFEVHGDEKRTVVELDDIAEHAKEATIAAEDKDFYTHHGFKLTGFIRAFFKNILSGERGQGGSTITQQFVKNAVLSPEKTYTRKLKELVLSLELERRFTKDQILKLYLNEIPYGSVVYGIESAAETYFGKKAGDLALSESAVLAALPKATTYYSPYGSHQDALMERAHFIIDTMAEEGYVSREEADEAKKDPVLERILPQSEAIVAPHFVFYVKEILAKELGDQLVERGGLKVITTLDVDKQTIAEKSVDDNILKVQGLGGSTAALLSIDPRTGEILAMVGSADYFNDEIKGKYNALQGSLQPGSSIKPIVYAAAFEKGYTPDTVLYDVVTTFQDEPKYEPRNYDLVEHGPVTLREALAGSLNIPAVKVLYLTGMNAFFEFAQKMGYTTFTDRSRYGLSLVLGGGNVTPIEHINAFSAFAEDGVLREPKAVLKVESKGGEVLLDATSPSRGKRVIEKEVARQISGILSDNAARAFIFGEQNYLTLGERPVAAKTGTTNDYKDAWTIGYVPTLVAGVWVGNADGSAMGKGADGSVVAAPIWNQYMREALVHEPYRAFEEPLPVVTGKPVLDGARDAQMKVRIDTASGKLATDHTPPEYVEERGFGIPHSILFFVDKNDPRGGVPADPSADPQFQRWEDAVLRWATEKQIVMSQPPTEYDDVHVPENIPTVRILSPGDGGTVATRVMPVTLEVSARRPLGKIEYSMDGDIIATRTWYPFWGSVTVPNRFTKGFHTFSARVYDDVGNSTTATTTINLIAEPGPLGIQWISPWNYQSVSRSGEFPFTVKFSIDDPKSIASLRLIADPQASGEPIVIGTIGSPSFQNMTMQWNPEDAPLGRYDLIIEATLNDGTVRQEGIVVTVW